MSTILETAKTIYDAFDKKDLKALPGLIHPDYVGIMPGMTFKGIDAMIQCTEQCPFINHSENITYIVEGDKVVRIWDMVATAPVSFRLRMMELMHIKDGKMFYTETVFDTNAFPAEAKALFGNCENTTDKKEKALSK
ncbi:MAG: nuclear transport factor 2 family protein [Candidatus Obscuribacter sp.]|nr:nuclear transport factor 2 family protein [Candidatus Obscuribacter sp.]